MILVTLIAIAGPTAPASRQQAPLAASDEGWKDLNRVAMVVNEDIVTTLRIEREIRREDKKSPIRSEDDLREVERRVRVNRLKEMIAVQAGQDMGLDPAQVERSAKDFLERRLEDFPSTGGKAAFLQEMDVTLHEAEEQVREQIYARTWRQYVTGEGPLTAGARPSRDRFARPGYMVYAWRESLEHPELLRQIGGRPQEVVLQQLYLDPEPAGGEEAGHALALELRQRILDGEDMGELVLKHGAALKKERGLSEAQDEARLSAIDPVVGEFLAHARPGDLSEPLAFRSRGGGKLYLRLLRLVDRSEPVIPDFGSSEIQRKIAEKVRVEQDGWRSDRAYDVIFRASYVWPAELAGR